MIQSWCGALQKLGKDKITLMKGGIFERLDLCYSVTISYFSDHKNRKLMIDFSHCDIKSVAVHRVGSRTNDESILFSRKETEIADDELKRLLIKYFTSPFDDPEYYSFTSSDEDFSLNPVYQLSSQIFAESGRLHPISKEIAQLLYDRSEHPNIKSGDLFAVLFSDVQIDDEITDAVGIFKSENRHSFLKLDNRNGEFHINHEDGINIEKLDKGCIILNYDADKGFKVCIVDKSSKSSEAMFWRDAFLQVQPCSDEYHYTTDYMKIAKEFVIKHLPQEREVEKMDQIEYLNRSADYFKKKEKFSNRDFEESVFQDDRVIDSFREYRSQHPAYQGMDQFDISQNAVQKQLKVYKSVLKLDNNFHIYIHGNSELIEKGTDRDGRKYYKIYFENEK